MKLTTLICLAARERFGQGASIGVRLSPIYISAAEASEIALEAAKTSGWEVFVAVAAPGAEPLDQERACVSPDERAAARATDWRNNLSSKDRQRILYVSAEEQGRAGGLLDTLQPLSEDALREALLLWAIHGQDVGLPSALAQALKAAGVDKYVSVRALCDYSERVSASIAGGDLWEVAGEHLPTLGLLCDSALTESDAAARVAENVKLVRLAARGDLQALKRPSLELRALVDALSVAFRSSPGLSMEGALAALDLAQLSTEALVGKPTARAPKQPKIEESPLAPLGKATKRAPKSESAKPAQVTAGLIALELPSAPELERRALTVSPIGLSALEPPQASGAAHQAITYSDAPALSGPFSSRAAAQLSGEDPPRRRGRPPKQPSLDARAPAPPLRADHPDAQGPPAEPALAVEAPTSALTAAELQEKAPEAAEPAAIAAAGGSPNPKPRQNLWRDANQAKLFGEVDAKLKPGLAHMLSALDQAGGHGLRWSLPKGPLRKLLDAVPKTLSAPTCAALSVPAELSALALARGSARAELARYLAQRKQHLATLITSPLRALGDGAFLALAEALVGASEALIQAALPLDDAALLDNLAALETVSLSAARDQERLILLGPLHPLWLGQQVARARALFSAPSLDDEARRLAAAAASAPQAAPPRWEVAGERPLARGEGAGCLIMYETLPLSLSEDVIRSACAKLFSSYLSIFPHAHLSACVELRGRVSAAAIEGLMAGASDDLRKLEVRLSALPALPEDSSADKAVASGLLSFGPIVASGQQGVGAPHLVVCLDPPHAQAPAQPPSALKALAADVAPLEARRLLTSQGLSTLTGVRGVPGAEAVEALLAKRAGKPALGALWSTAKPHALSSIYAEAAPAPITWRAVVSSDVVASHEGKGPVVFSGVVEGARVIVTAEDTAPLLRALEGAIAQLGLSDRFPQLQTERRAMIGALAKESVAGVLGLDGSAASGRVLLALLARAMRSTEHMPTQHVITPLGDAASRALPPSELRRLGAETLLCAAVKDGVLTLTIGCVSASPDAQVEVKRRALDGELGRLLDGFASALLRANTDDLGGQRARELICDLLWPALAMAHAEGALLSPLKAALESLQSATQRVSVQLLLLLKGEHPLARVPHLSVGPLALSCCALERLFP